MDKGYLVGNRYEIIRTLGEGGMANVYLANDIRTNQKVAVKALRYDLQDDESVKRRFEREAKATGTLSHPHIVNILYVCNDNGNQYIIIEYVHGPNLKKYIREHFPIPYHEVVDIMEQICSAVAEAHAHGIIHRDLKPENILVDDSKDPIQVKVSDFGIALALSDRSITRTNSLLGSVHYMSPEQIRGGSATALSDIYALGIILYELLAKTVPFQGDTAVAVALKHSKEDIPDLQKIDPNIPQALENVVLRATAKDPNQRYQAVTQMHDDLSTCLLPERAGEKKFVPIPTNPMANNNLDETRVMPPLHETGQRRLEPPKKKSKKKRNIIVASIIAVLAVIILLFMVFKGNQETTVPDLGNLTLKQARVMLRGADLQVGNITKENDDNVDAGHVIRSVPNKGLKMKNNADVNLFVSLGATYYKMPNLVGKEYDDISDNLSKRGFKVKLKYMANNNYTAGTILQQSVSPGKKVIAKKQTLTLTLAKAQPARKKVTHVRDLTGYNLKSIQDYAKEINVTLDVSYDFSDSISDGLLISQTPSANSVINPGDTLSVTMSKGPEDSKNNSTSDSDSNNDSNNSSSNNNNNSNNSSNSTKTVTRSINIPYTNDGTNSPNKVTIYLGDNNHNVSNVYRTMNISQDTPLTLSFSLKDGQTGNYTVENNNSTVLSGSVSG